MQNETVDKAFEFIHRYGNVGKDVSDLKANKPTESKLKAVRERCYAEVDLAIRVVAKFHDGDSPE